MQPSLGPSAHLCIQMPLFQAQGEDLLTRVATETAGGIIIDVPGLGDLRTSHYVGGRHNVAMENRF